MTDFQPPPPPGMDVPFWDRTLLGLKMKYALPLFGAVIIGGVVFFMWYRNKSSASAANTSATTNADNSTLSASGAQLAAAGLAPYYGTGAPTAGNSPVSGGAFTTRGDTSYGSGSIPVVDNINPTGPNDTIASLPETTALQSLGVSIANPTPLTGSWPGQGARQFYNVTLPGGQTGYIMAQDLNLQPNPTQASSFYSGATSLPTGSVSSLYQQTGYANPSYPYLTGY